MNRFQLKLLMLFLMVIDHIGWFIPDAPIWFNYIGRIVAPVFFFLLVDGYFHTSNRYNYAKRLTVAAGIMTTGNLLISILFPMEGKTITSMMYIISIAGVIALGFVTWRTYKASAYDGKRILSTSILFAFTPLLFHDIFVLTNNIFLSMALGIMVLNTIEYGKIGQGRVAHSLTILGILFITAFTEGSLMTSSMVLIFYYLRQNKKMLSVFYIVLSLVFGLNDLSYQGLFIENYQWMMVFALPFFFIYNGEKGKDIKYLFYGFYPLHIWILYIIGFFIRDGRI